MTEQVHLNVDVTHLRKSTEVFLDFQWKSLIQTVDVICKGVGFYFVVLLGAIGVIYQSKLGGLELRVATSAIVLISIAVSIGCGFLAWGVISGLYDVQKTLRSFNPEVFDEQGMNKYFMRARIAARAVMVSCLIVLIVIISSLLAIQFK